VPAAELQVGDEFLLHDGGRARLIGIRIESAAAGTTFTTYNIEVEEDHTYHVGQLGTWVHNTGAEDCARPAERLTELVNAAPSDKIRKQLETLLKRNPDLRRRLDPRLARQVDELLHLVPRKGWRSTNAWDTSTNAHRLRRNMGQAIQSGEVAHHIVPSTHRRAKRARALLDHYQIDINDAVNGVGLNPTDHRGRGLHSYEGIKRVTDRLEGAIKGAEDWGTGRRNLLRAIQALLREILKGHFP